MATIEEMENASRQRAEELRRNPLLKLSLGELVGEMIGIYARTPYVILPADQVPGSSKEDYSKFRAIIDELDSREKSYKTHKREPVFRASQI